jgi:hypothetical protein
MSPPVQRGVIGIKASENRIQGLTPTKSIHNSATTSEITPKSLQSQFGQKYDHNSARNS